MIPYNLPTAPGERSPRSDNRGPSLGVDGKLFTFSSLEQPVSHLFVNFPPVADGENPDHSGFAIQFVGDAKPPDFDSP